MRIGWRIEGSMRGSSRAGARDRAWLGALAVMLMAGTGCSGPSLDGYRIAWVGPIFKHGVSSSDEAIHKGAQDELASALERNEVFPKVTKVVNESVPDGVMCYITGILRSKDGTEQWETLEVTIKDATSASVLAENVFAPEDWEVGGEDARVPFLVARLVEYIAEIKTDSPADKKP